MDYYWKFDNRVKFRQPRHKWVFSKTFQSKIIFIKLSCDQTWPSITCKLKIKFYLEEVFKLYKWIKQNQQKQIQNFVNLPSEHPEDNGIIIPLWKRKLRSKAEASILSLHFSSIRLCSRIKDYQSHIETKVYIIFTTDMSVQLKAENCRGFKCTFLHVGKTWTDSSCFV